MDLVQTFSSAWDSNLQQIALRDSGNVGMSFFNTWNDKQDLKKINKNLKKELFIL